MTTTDTPPDLDNDIEKALALRTDWQRLADTVRDEALDQIMSRGTWAERRLPLYGFAFGWLAGDIAGGDLDRARASVAGIQQAIAAPFKVSW